MDCKEVLFSDHAVTQMFKRSISIDQAKSVLECGEVIANYSTDKPYPSCLMLGFISNKPIHIVVGRDEDTGRCVIITAYEPDPNIWEADFKSKKQ